MLRSIVDDTDVQAVAHSLDASGHEGAADAEPGVFGQHGESAELTDEIARRPRIEYDRRGPDYPAGELGDEHDDVVTEDRMLEPVVVEEASIGVVFAVVGEEDFANGGDVILARGADQDVAGVGHSVTSSKGRPWARASPAS